MARFLSFLKRNRLWLFLSLLIFVGFTGQLAVKRIILHSYDSSAGGEELLDLAPVSPPAEIQEKINKIKQPTPGTSTAPVYRIPILMYHYVEPVADKTNKVRTALTTTPEVLESDLRALKSRGYTFLTASDLADILDGKAGLPAKPILLTFDDSYEDFYTEAYPILKKYRAKATQYVISGFINKPDHLTAQQIEIIAKEGLVEIGAHTVHHFWLKGLSVSKVNVEIAQSRDALEKLIDKPVTAFAYPFGAFDNQTIESVRKAGFTTAVSTQPGTSQSEVNRYFLFRLRPGGRVEAGLIDWLNRQGP
ncbi:MAG: polysaccharide deacetylase family protein [Patescibacteria group bacterium]|nr:polysaccharide deacetylase family protein [Patescibacteria group bacterium]